MAPLSPSTRKIVSSDALLSASPTAAKLRSFSWRDVAAHNTPDSAWVIIDREVYDITQFLDKHPGGREILLVAAGRECSDLFTSYHWWDGATKARLTMAKYRIGVLQGPTEFPTYAPDTAGFYKTLSARVRAHFESTRTDPKSPWAGLWRLALIFSVAALCYATVNGLLFPSLPFAPKLLLAAFFGVVQALPLLHAMHDASHAAIGHSETWWKVVGRLCLDWFAGGCMITWHHQHTVGHHVYTNVVSADPDVPNTATGDARYMSSNLQVWGFVYRFQWLYLPVLYGLLGLLTRIQDVLQTYIARMSGPVRVNFYNSPVIRLLLTKGVWVGWRVLLPLFYFGVPASTFWPLFLVTEAATGFHLAWNFEVSHVADTVAWHDAPVPSDSAHTEPGVLPMSWAASQAATSVDYSHDSWATTFVCGALNYQIEHHLFPSISQYHYPALAPLVKETCREFGVPYRYEPSFWAAWCAHVRYLYTMGNGGDTTKLSAAAMGDAKGVSAPAAKVARAAAAAAASSTASSSTLRRRE